MAIEGDPEQLPGDDLVPVRLRLFLGEAQVLDTFLWNKRDGLPQMQRFAEGLCQDTGVPLSLAPVIVKDIKRQVEEWAGRAQPPKLAPGTERLEVIRLDFAIGVTRFSDQFLWDMYNPAASPEAFALHLSADLGLEGGVAVEVACKLRDQLAHLRRQAPKSTPSLALLVSADPVSDEPPHTSGRARKRKNRHAEGGTKVHGPLRSLQHTRCVRPPEQWEEWGPDVHSMGSEEALRFAREAAMRAEAEAAAAHAARAEEAAVGEAAAEVDQAEALVSPGSTCGEGGEGAVRQLRPRRTVRLTELMMALDSPRGPSTQSMPPAGGGGKGVHPGAPPLGGGPATAPSAAATAGVGGMPSPSDTSAGGLLFPSSFPNSSGRLPRELSARQQQMLQRRQMLLQEASQGAGGRGTEALLPIGSEPNCSGSLSQQQLSAILRHQPHQQHADLLSTSQQLSQMSGLLAQDLLLDHPNPATSAALPLRQTHHQQLQQLQQQQELQGALGMGMKGVPEAVGGGVPLPVQPSGQMRAGQGGGAGGSQMASMQQLLQQHQQQLLLQEMQAPQLAQQAQGARGSGAVAKKSPYANLFGEMFEDAPSTAPMQLEGSGQPGLLMDGSGSSGLAGMASFLGMRGSSGLQQQQQMQQMQHLPTMTQGMTLQQMQMGGRGGEDVADLVVNTSGLAMGNPNNSSLFF